jgi:hypothetical protein
MSGSIGGSGDCLGGRCVRRGFRWVVDEGNGRGGELALCNDVIGRRHVMGEV